MSRKNLWGFEVLDEKTWERVDGDYAMTDMGELLKKNAKGVWLPVAENKGLAVVMEISAAKRW